MIDEFKNILLAGIGAAATSYEKSSKLVDEMVKKGKLTVEEGKELSEDLKRNLKEKVSEKSSKEEAQGLSKDDIRELFKEMNFATKDDLKSIEDRLLKLEAESTK